MVDKCLTWKLQKALKCNSRSLRTMTVFLIQYPFSGKMIESQNVLFYIAILKWLSPSISYLLNMLSSIDNKLEIESI